MRGAVAALGLVLAGWPLAAVAQTAITPDTAAGRGLGTTVTQAGRVVSIDGGTRAGANLFHSFAGFDLGAGDTALWTRSAGDGAQIANVVNRVTGGQPSTIAGVLDSTALPNAAFYFVNPAGIVFAPGAKVNVPAAAHFSTAAELRFSDGAVFAAATPGGSTLSVAAPQAFGFLGGQGDISIHGVDDDFSSERATLGFTAGSLRVEDSTIYSRGLDLIAVGAGAASVRIENPLASLHDGVLQLFNSDLRVIETTVGGRSMRLSGGDIEMETTGLLSNGNIFVNAARSVTGDFMNLDVFSVTREAAGAVVIRAPQVAFTDSLIQAQAIETGGPGQILIETGDLFLSRVEMTSDAKDGVGADPGLIRMRSTGDLTIFASEIRSNANGAADGGQVSIEGFKVDIAESKIQSDTFGLATGSAGAVSVKANELLLGINGQITSTTNGEGLGGNVLVDAGTLNMDLKAAIRSDTRGSGAAGSVTVLAGTASLDGASITSSAEADIGDAGSVSINVGRLTMRDSTISSGTKTRGAGGRVFIQADDILLDGGRRKFTNISSDTFGDGDAGDVFIQAKTMVVRNGAFISSDTVSNPGAAGDVSIVAEDLRLENGGSISSDTFDEGAAGNVTIQAGRLAVVGGDFDLTFISSDSLSTGNAGTVSVLARSILADNFGFISSDAYAGGEGGTLVIAADDVTLRNGGNIRSRTFSLGGAGSVLLEAKRLTLESGGTISSEATQRASGNAGLVSIAAETIRLGEGSRITTATQGAGDAGVIDIASRTFTVDGGTISSSAEGDAAGAPRELSITAQTLQVLNGGAISTVSVNPNPAGRIAIGAETLLVDGLGSVISSENGAGRRGGPGGSAGTIEIRSDGMTVSNGARITTNAFAGPAGDISIDIPRPGFLTLEGAQAPGVIQTSSGPGTGGRITISDPLAIISNGGSILALGQLRGANVVIQSRYFINSTDRANVLEVDGDFKLETGLYDVSSGIAARDLSVLDASRVLRGQCPATRSTGAVSQLITRPVGPYAPEPQTLGPAVALPPAVAGGCL